jgi:hypothetical protein
MGAMDAERTRLLQALEDLEREQHALDVRDQAAVEVYRRKLAALRQRIAAFRSAKAPEDKAN